MLITSMKLRAGTLHGCNPVHFCIRRVRLPFPKARLLAVVVAAVLGFAVAPCGYAQQPPPPPPPAAPTPADALYASAQQDLKESQFTQAETKFANFAAKFPNDARVADALLQQGICEMKLGRKDDAVRAWNWLMQRHPASSQVADAMEQLVVARNFPNSARGEQALFTCAWLYWAHEKWKLGRPAFDDYLRAYPEAINHPPVRKYIQDCDEGLSGAKKP